MDLIKNIEEQLKLIKNKHSDNLKTVNEFIKLDKISKSTIDEKSILQKTNIEINSLVKILNNFNNDLLLLDSDIDNHIKYIYKKICKKMLWQNEEVPIERFQIKLLSYNKINDRVRYLYVTEFIYIYDLKKKLWFKQYFFKAANNKCGRIYVEDFYKEQNRFITTEELIDEVVSQI